MYPFWKANGQYISKKFKVYIYFDLVILLKDFVLGIKVQMWGKKDVYRV